MDDTLIIGGRALRSRLFIGTGKFGNPAQVREAITRSGVEVVTVAVRRVDPRSAETDIRTQVPDECLLLPNTSGARTADEAVRIARLARAAGCGDWVKIEVVADNRYLLPDNEATIHATETLAREGFTVLPYMAPDLYAARRLHDAGAAAIMPLGAPIGTGRGLRTRELVEILVHECTLPVVVDAGLGMPSDAALCMELGCAAVLVNTAIATAADPPAMCEAFAEAVRAGRRAFLAGGCGAQLPAAQASSPLTGFLHGDTPA